MSFPVEASEATPGHAGHTPQHVDMALRRARARGILSSTLALLVPTEYALQPVRRPTQRAERSSQVSTLLRIEDYRRRADVRQPWPGEAFQGLQPRGDS